MPESKSKKRWPWLTCLAAPALCLSWTGPQSARAQWPAVSDHREPAGRPGGHFGLDESRCGHRQFLCIGRSACGWKDSERPQSGRRCATADRPAAGKALSAWRENLRGQVEYKTLVPFDEQEMWRIRVTLTSSRRRRRSGGQRGSNSTRSWVVGTCCCIYCRFLESVSCGSRR